MIAPVRLTRILVLTMSTTLFACDSTSPQGPQEAAQDKTAQGKAPGSDADKAGSGDKASGAGQIALPKICDLIDAQLVRTQAGLDKDAPIVEGDQLGADQVSEDSASCSWRFGGKTIALQVTREPSSNKFDTWASRMVDAKKSQGFEAVDGLADGAAFKAKESHLMFRHGESWLYSLSYAGDRPGDVMALAPLKALAASVPKP